MKPFIALLLCLLLVPFLSRAQQFEVRVNLNSGLFYYGGDGAESVSRINGSSYTNNPYGSRGGLSYGLSLDTRKITKKHFIYGADLGYEMLRSKVKLEYTEFELDVSYHYEGKTFLNTSFINLYPYIGGRFKLAGKPLDIIGGIDMAYVLSAREEAEARSTDQAQFQVEVSRDRKNIKTDLRPRLQISTAFNKVGLYFGYSHGLRNYQRSMLGSNPHTYSRMMRAGLSYQLR